MMGLVLATSAMRDGKNVTNLPAYGAEMRGGTANCTVVISDNEIFAPVASFPDYAVIMNNPSLSKYEGIIKGGGLMIINSSLVDRDPKRADLETVKIPVNDIAKELGSDRTINMIMLGAFVTKTHITSLDSIMNGLSDVIGEKKVSASVMKLNRKGLDRGAEYVLKGA